MRRRRLLLAFALIAFIGLSFAAVFLLSGRYGGGRQEIVLPPPEQSVGVGTIPPSHLNEPSDYTELDITGSGALALIRSLKRPEYYTAAFTSVLIDGDKFDYLSLSVEYTAAACRITTRDCYYLSSGGNIYTVSSGGVHSAAGGDFTVWQLSRLPDPGQLPSVSDDEITGFGFSAENGTHTIYIEYFSGGYMFRVKYSLDSGLAVMTEVYSGSSIVFKTAMQSADYSRPDDSRFALPS